MYQAIQTKFIGPTDRRGARVKASAYSGSKTVPFEYGANLDGAHHIAAKALAEKLKWVGVWVYGGSPDGEGNVYVNISTRGQGSITALKLKAAGSFAFEVLP